MFVVFFSFTSTKYENRTFERTKYKGRNSMPVKHDKAISSWRLVNSVLVMSMSNIVIGLTIKVTVNFLF